MDAQNFFVYHVSPREWAEHGLDLFEGNVESKTLHQACWAALWLMVLPFRVSNLLGRNTQRMVIVDRQDQY